MAEAAITEFSNHTNITEANKITYGAKVGTPEGFVIAYGSLMLIAVFPIVFGSSRSASYLKKQKLSGKNLDGNWTGALILFGLYILQCSQNSSNDVINFFFTGYFFSFAMISLTSLLSHMTTPLMPDSVLKRMFIFNSISYHGLLCMATSIGIYVWYILTKHWIVHDLIGVAFVVCGIEQLQWSNFVTGYGIFGGFTYIVHWIFGTNGEVSAFTTSEAPFIRLAFPIDLLENGLDANHFAAVGCCSILLPGVFIALFHRFENSLKRGTNWYFYVTTAAYVFGPLISILVKVLYGQHIPTLPLLACLGTPLFLAFLKGDMKAMFKYNDYAAEELIDAENVVEKGKQIPNKSPAISA